jgi:hypothetical protein
LNNLTRIENFRRNGNRFIHVVGYPIGLAVEIKFDAAWFGEIKTDITTVRGSIRSIVFVPRIIQSRFVLEIPRRNLKNFCQTPSLSSKSRCVAEQDSFQSLSQLSSDCKLPAMVTLLGFGSLGGSTPALTVLKRFFPNQRKKPSNYNRRRR